MVAGGLAVVAGSSPVDKDCDEEKGLCYKTQEQKNREMIALGVTSAVYATSAIFGYYKSAKCRELREESVSGGVPWYTVRNDAQPATVKPGERYDVNDRRVEREIPSDSAVPARPEAPPQDQPIQEPPATSPPAEEPFALSLGTCFAIGPRSVATSLHVVGNARAISVVLSDGETANATIAGSSAATDLVVLDIDHDVGEYLRVSDTAALAIGDRVFTIGFPFSNQLGLDPKYVEGTISSMSSGGENSLMQVSMPVHPGNSGGALVTETGRVVGVISAKANAAVFLRDTGDLPQNIAFATKSDYLIPLVPRTKRAGSTSRKISRRAIIDRTKRATCKVFATKPAGHTP